jgi:FkbM family methyltransferase
MYVPRLLQQKGFAGYEPESLACFLTAIEVTKRGAVLDVGANVGVYGVLASALTGRQVVAFEPAPDLAVTARAIADENGLSITLEEVALGAAPGRATLYLSDTTDSSNSLAQGFRPSTRQVDVRVETLDEVVQRMGLTASVIKIDTEMTEPDVLRGAEGTIRRHRPWILCEILAGRTEAQLTEIIEPWGYTWYHVTDDPPWAPAQELAGDPTYKNFMWLFAPTPLDGRFWSGLRGWRGSLAACVPLPAEAPRAEAPEAPLSERAAPHRGDVDVRCPAPHAGYVDSSPAPGIALDGASGGWSAGRGRWSGSGGRRDASPRGRCHEEACGWQHSGAIVYLA